jgi:hypothetical protein
MRISPRGLAVVVATAPIFIGMFYERSGFRLRGRARVLHELGGVTEVCYERDIAPP